MHHGRSGPEGPIFESPGLAVWAKNAFVLNCATAMRDDLITSRQNQRVKNAVKLRDRRAREKQRRTLIDGVRELGCAIDAGVPLLEAFVCEPLCNDDARQNVLRQLDATEAIVSYVTAEVFEKLAFGERAEGVVGVVSTPAPALSDLALPPKPIVAVLEGIEKPGNVGAVIRSADAAGVAAVIVADGGTDLFNPAAIRASLGTIFAMPVAAASSRDTLSWLGERGLPIFATQPDASLAYTEVDWTAGGAIVFGSETRGLSDAWRCDRVTPIGLPMRGVTDSLNVSATAAVLFYEALRQRG